MDQSNNKKKIIILISIFVILIIIMFLLSFSQNKKIGEKPDDQKTEEITNIAQIIDETIYYPTITSDSNILFFAGKEQSIKKYSLKENKVIKQYPLEIPYILEVLWSDDQNLVLITTQNQENGQVKLYSYNLALEKIAELNDNMINPYWEKDKIIYQFYQGETNTLNQADWDGKNWEKISDLTSCDSFIYYNKQQKEVFCEIDKEDMVVDFAKISLETKKINFIYQGVFLSETFYPNSDYILIQYLKDNKNNYELINKVNGNITKILDSENINNSQKFHLNSEKMFYALNSEPTKNDLFYIFDIKTKSTETINFLSKDLIDPQNILIDSNDSTIYFISDQLLYKLKPTI